MDINEKKKKTIECVNRHVLKMGSVDIFRTEISQRNLTEKLTAIFFCSKMVTSVCEFVLYWLVFLLFL